MQIRTDVTVYYNPDSRSIYLLTIWENRQEYTHMGCRHLTNTPDILRCYHDTARGRYFIGGRQVLKSQWAKRMRIPLADRAKPKDWLNEEQRAKLQQTTGRPDNWREKYMTAGQRGQIAKILTHAQL